MQRITWYALVAVVALVAPIGGQAPAPTPAIKEIATIPGVNPLELVRLPNGRGVIYTVDDGIFSFDIATKRSTLLTGGFEGNLRVSPAGDRIAFYHPSEDGKTSFIWAMPISPVTGLAAGPAQRVSLTAGDTPGFSPDGKLISFGVVKDDTNDLAVVPTTGGPERVLAKYQNLRRTSWSADGTAIFVVQGTGSSSSVDRVPIGGGPAESLMSYTGVARGHIDGQIAFYHPDAAAQSEGRVAYKTASGAQGEVRIPLHCPADNSFPACSVRGEFDAVKSVWWHTTRSSVVRAVNVADGKVRDLLPGQITRAASWSPDGRRIVFQDSLNGQFAINVMNADGSGQRRYPVGDPRGRQMRWSPNGQLLAYYPGPRYGPVAVLDLATGKTRVVASPPAPRWIHGFSWRPDSRSLVIVKSSPSGDPNVEVCEAGLDGTERKLHDLSTTLPRSGFYGIVSDERILISGSGFKEQAVFSIADGSTTRLPGTERRFGWPGVSRDGQQLLWMIVNADGSITGGQLMDVRANTLRTLRFPFTVDRTFPWARLHPDGRHAILIGKTAGETASRVFLLPLNGGAPRALAQLSGRVDNMWLSPDGRTLLFDMDGPPTTTIYELDASPILETIRKR